MNQSQYIQNLYLQQLQQMMGGGQSNQHPPMSMPSSPHPSSSYEGNPLQNGMMLGINAGRYGMDSEQRNDAQAGMLAAMGSAMASPGYGSSLSKMNAAFNPAMQAYLQQKQMARQENRNDHRYRMELIKDAYRTEREDKRLAAHMAKEQALIDRENRKLDREEEKIRLSEGHKSLDDLVTEQQYIKQSVENVPFWSWPNAKSKAKEEAQGHIKSLNEARQRPGMNAPQVAQPANDASVRLQKLAQEKQALLSQLQGNK